MEPRNNLYADPELDDIPSDYDDLKPSEFGLDWGDIIQIRENLEKTPTERLKAAQDLMNFAIRVRNQNGL